MHTCEFFREYIHIQTGAHRPVSGGSPTRQTTFPYCDHPHSTVTLARVRGGNISGPKLLACGGDLSKCQVPEQFRPHGE